jgi:hypothetical protein
MPLRDPWRPCGISLERGEKVVVKARDHDEVDVGDRRCCQVGVHGDPIEVVDGFPVQAHQADIKGRVSPGSAAQRTECPVGLADHVEQIGHCDRHRLLWSDHRDRHHGTSKHRLTGRGHRVRSGPQDVRSDTHLLPWQAQT